MPIVLDPDKQLIGISTYYVEEVKKHGNSVFHFIRSQDDFDEWKGKGYTPEDQLSPEQPKPEKIINKIVTYWKTVSWRDNNTILAKSLKSGMKADGTTYQEIDGIAYRDMKLKTCLKRWSLMNEEGHPIEVSDAVIDNMDPMFAHELLTSFEEITEPSAKDLKN